MVGASASRPLRASAARAVPYVCPSRQTYFWNTPPSHEQQSVYNSFSQIRRYGIVGVSDGRACGEWTGVRSSEGGILWNWH